MNSVFKVGKCCVILSMMTVLTALVEFNDNEKTHMHYHLRQETNKQYLHLFAILFNFWDLTVGILSFRPQSGGGEM